MENSWWKILLFPPLEKGGCEKIDLVLFQVIPAKAGITCFQSVSNFLTLVFTGVTAKIQFFQSFKGRETNS